MRFARSPLTRSCEEGTILNGFQFGTSTGRSSSDSTASPHGSERVKAYLNLD